MDLLAKFANLEQIVLTDDTVQFVNDTHRRVPGQSPFKECMSDITKFFEYIFSVLAAAGNKPTSMRTVVCTGE